MGAVNRHVEPEAGVTEIRIHGVGGTTPDALLEQTGTWQVAGDDIAGFYRGAISDPTRTVEAYSWGGLTAKSRSRAFWVLLLPFSLVNLAGWMVEPRPLKDDEVDRQDGGGGKAPQVAVDRDFGTKVHETIVQLIAMAVTAMYVMWTALVSVNTVAFQCGAIPECREDRWYADFLGAGYFIDHPGRRVVVGLLLPLALLGLFMFLARRSRTLYDDYASGEQTDISADTIEETRTAIGRASFWLPGKWQRQTARLHVAVSLLIIAGLLGRAVGPFEEQFGVDVASEQLGSGIFWISALFALVAVFALTAATHRSDPLLGDGVPWFEPVSKVIQRVAVGLLVVAGWLTLRLEGPDSELLNPGPPVMPQTDFWGFGWTPVILLIFGIFLVGVFSVVQVARWIEWHFIHFDQILVAAMLLLIVFWRIAVWVAVVLALIAIGANSFERFKRSRVAHENGDRTVTKWRSVVFVGFMAATILLRIVSDGWPSPFGIGWPRMTPIVFFTAGLIALNIVQVNGHLNSTGIPARPRSVQLALFAIPVAIVGIGWVLSATLNRDEWAYGAAGLAWCVAAVAWLAQFEHSRWRWNGPGAVALLGLAIVMGAFSGLMIWLVDLLDRDGSEFVLRSTAIYQWLTVIFAAMLAVLVVGLVGWLIFVRVGMGRATGVEKWPKGEVLPVALRAIDVSLTVAVMVLLSSIMALFAHFYDTYGTDYLSWIDDGPPENWSGIVSFTGWIALGVVIGAVFAVRSGLKDRGFRTRFGILWDVAGFWPRSFHPFAPPPYTARAVPEIQSRLKEMADLDELAESDASGSSVHSAAILSGHSQGSVVSLAVIATLPPDVRRRVWLFTHGSPLARLYHRFFPMYFPVEVFSYCAQVGGDGRAASGRWLNYWRLTDPIGGPCFGAGFDPVEDEVPPPWSQAAIDAIAGEVATLPDICLADPLEPPTRYSPSPGVRGHSGYMADPAMWRALEVLSRELVKVADTATDVEPESG